MEQMTKDLGNMNMPNTSYINNNGGENTQQQIESKRIEKLPRFSLSPEELDNLDVKIVDLERQLDVQAPHRTFKRDNTVRRRLFGRKIWCIV